MRPFRFLAAVQDVMDGTALGELARRAEATGYSALLVPDHLAIPQLSPMPAMTAIALAVKDASNLPCGIQILAGANHEALAVAHAADLQFARVEGYAFAHVADEGIIESSAAALLRYRRAIGAERVQVWADVKKKHSAHALTADVDVGETAAAVEFMRADAVIVTGAATGLEASDTDLSAVRHHCRLPIYIGSGVSAENLARYAPLADGFIVGSFFKKDGRWSETVDPRRVERFMRAHAEAIRRGT